MQCERRARPVSPGKAIGFLSGRRWHICDVGLAVVLVREQPGRLYQRVGRTDVIDVD